MNRRDQEVMETKDERPNYNEKLTSAKPNAAFTHRTSTFGGCRRNRTGPVSAAI